MRRARTLREWLSALKGARDLGNAQPTQGLGLRKLDG